MENSKNVLTHLAIIMDGNGRWAKKYNKPRRDGHKAGVNVVRDITTWCAKNHISYLTLYAFSTENWNRPKAEVEFLMRLLLEYLKKEREVYLEHGIKFRTIGDISVFNNPLKDTIQSLQEESSQGDRLTQILALNYGGRDEIARAMLKVIKSLQQEDSLNNLDKTQAQDLLSNNLDTQGIPDVDLLIRTGGEMRVSNFLLWQANYAELHFTPTYWPDFSPKDLSKIIGNFRKKERRFGRV